MPFDPSPADSSAEPVKALPVNTPAKPALTVCFVSRKWPPAMGGMETYAHRLSERLAAHTAVRRIVLPGRANGTPPGTLRLLGFGLAAAARLAAARRPAKVIHVTDMASWPLALAAKVRAPRSRIVLSAHGTDVSYGRQPGPRGRLYAGYLRLGARLLHSATVLANSRATAAAAAEQGYADIRVVPLATDLCPQPGPAARDRILFAGRLLPMKGCGWFVRAVLPRLPDDITLQVIGTAWDADEVAALASPRVAFEGRRARSEMAAAYASALCVVVPNVDVPSRRFEGFGLVAAEAAAAGGVVLAADQGGLRDAVIDGITGFLLAPGDAAAWVQAITALRDWPVEGRAAFVGASTAAARQAFSWERVACETLSVYREPAPRRKRA